MFKFVCPACGYVFITIINDDVDCPICYSMLEFKGAVDSTGDKAEQ